MYATLLTLHSIVRWLVLASLLYALFRAFRGWFGGRNFTAHDNSVRHNTATIAHIQLMLGLVLYWISPVIQYFLDHFKVAVKNREIRFFGMEHSIMMLLAVVLITIGSMQAKRKTDETQKFKTMAIWFLAAFLVILSSIPWSFSPLVQRPLLRWF